MQDASSGSKLKSSFQLTIPGTTDLVRMLVLIITLGAILWTIHLWLLNFYDISNDPACYINAADNLVKTGRLVDFGNWVSRTLSPVVEPYTEWPPGTPLFLAPFILVFRDPMVAAVVAQCALIVLAYVALLAMASALELKAVPAIGLIAAFTYLHPFIISNTQYGSETIFFVLTLAAGYFAVKIAREGPTTGRWVLSLLFTFLASSVRFTGVANIGWFIPLLAPKLTLRRSSGDPATKTINRIILSAGILMLIGSVWVDEIGFYVTYKIHMLHFILLITGCAAFVIGLGFIPTIEHGGGATEESGKGKWKSRVNILRVLAVAAAFGPALLWFTRNSLMYGDITRSHGMFTEFNQEGIVETPLMLCFYMLKNPLVHQTVSFLLLTLLALTPVMIGGTKERTLGAMLVVVTLFHVGTLWGSSLLATFAYLNGRLMSPTILLAMIAVLYGLNVLFRANVENRLKYAFLFLPFLFLATNRHVDFKSPSLLSWGVKYPKEMYLWKQIHTMKWTRNSSQVYTELNYRHQMFSGIPQKIYWNTNLLTNPSALDTIFAHGRKPFLVFPRGGSEDRMIRNTIDVYDFKLDSVIYPKLGYILYYKPPQ